MTNRREFVVAVVATLVITGALGTPAVAVSIIGDDPDIQEMGRRIGRGSARSTSKLRSAGPRFGLVHIMDEATQARLKENNASSVVTAWGWQFEYEYLNTGGGTTGLVEFVPLVLGLESGIALPSVTVLLGVRLENGFEIGFGPNVGVAVRGENEKVAAGVGMTGAIGTTLRSGRMNFPINLAALRNENGFRVSLLVGWNRSN